MSTDTTENDAEIARILAEEYDYESSSAKRSKPSSPSISKRFKTDTISSSIDVQIDDDSEMALILQIEEIVLSENHINKTTSKPNDGQFEKTHAAMTQALLPTDRTDWLARVLGMFGTIQTRYNDCQTRNQVLINQIQNLSIQLYPALKTFQTQDHSAVSKAAVPTLAIGLISNVLQGRIEMDDAKQIIVNVLKLWNDSSVWYEFFEQFVYILVAMTVPCFAQGAMGKIMEKVSSSK